MKKNILLIVTILVVGFFIPNIRHGVYDLFYQKNNQIDMCRNSQIDFSRVYTKINNVINEHKEALPKNYIALKSFSQAGVNYFLLLKYKSDYLLITYFSIGGLKSRVMSASEGNEMFSSLLGMIKSNIVNDHNKEGTHLSCDFVRLRNEGKQYDFSILNGGNKQDSTANTVLGRIDTIMSNEYRLNYSNQEKNSSNQDYGTNTRKVDILEKSYRNDMFFELKNI